MEHHITKPIHIEFFGLPGCGKSTLSKLLSEILRQNGFCVKEPSFETEHIIGSRRLLKKIIIGLKFSFMQPANTYKVAQIVNNNGYGFFSVSWVKLTLNILLKLYVYKQRKVKNQQVFVWDQGLIQAMVSVVYEKSQVVVPVWDELINLFDQNNRILPIYVKVNKEVAIKRMQDRGKNGARLEKETNRIEKERLIINQVHCFDSVCSIFDNVYIIENNGRIADIDFSELLSRLGI